MITHTGYEHLNITRPVVTLGIFDGVHRGHKLLLNRLVTLARQESGESVVITFSPHPRLILAKDNLNLSFLSTMEEKTALLDKANIDHLIILEFNKDFSSIPACDFIKEVLIKKVGTSRLVMGYNNRFGTGGEGDFSAIKHCSESLGLKVEQMQGLQTDAGIISSSLIRKALQNGNLDEANSLLGYYYSLTGIVAMGRKLGRKLGFPTANIKPDDRYKLIPGNGVYAVEVQLSGTEYKGMLSIGSNPTVNNDPDVRNIEVNILDFEGDIYNKRISVLFRNRLRDEKKFENTDQLVEQMKLDREHTIRLLS